MDRNQILILGIVAATVGAFLWGKWRHDMVAMGALLLSVFTGLVTPAEAFAGFGHPAVITVACVLVLSGALQMTGASDALTRRLIPASAGPTVTIAAMSGLAAFLSAFMNNVGALALLMPAAIRVAERQKVTPGRVLMPVAFGSILGGMTTLIGTPPNLIVSGFRASTGVGGFAMFDFTPVGLAVALGGVLFVGLVGWRLVPERERVGVDGFDIGAYLTEARVMESSRAAGQTLREVGKTLEAADAQVVSVIRSRTRHRVPSPDRVLQVGDILVIEAESGSLATVLSGLGLKLVEDVPVKAPDKVAKEVAKEAGDGVTPEGTVVEPAEVESVERAGKVVDDGEAVTLMELAVRPGTDLIGRSATDIQLRTRFGINLLALSRQGRRSISRLRTEEVRAGDVLLMQGPPAAVMQFASEYGLAPLAERSLRIPNARQAILATVIMGAAIAGAALGLVPAAVAFATGVLACMTFKVVSPRTVYEAVDWPVIVLLAGLIPVAGAMATTGAADSVARALVKGVAFGSPLIGLIVILVVTMTLSDFMNNAATAAVMCPIAIGTAGELGARPDSFLMAVAIGASCAFLTPIGHQNNTLILGPGGFRFGDYWRLGLPLELLVLAISIPLLLKFWPL